MKKILITLIILTIIAAGVYYVFNYLNKKQEAKIAKLGEKIGLLKSENIPLRFKILEKKDGYIKVAIKFYDADGKLIKDRIEKKLKGKELSFDFHVFPIKDKYISFPCKIYTDEIAPEDGEMLISYYDIESFPQVFFFEGIDEELKIGLSSVFEKIKTGDFNPDDEYFGNMVHDLPDFRAYNTDQTYKIVTRIKGGIEVIEE